MADDTLWELEQHTAAKHQILQKYLQAWLPIMSKYNDGLNLVDTFAGPGEYRDGEPGSPVVMLDCYLEHDHRDKIAARLRYFFIEEREDRAQHLERVLATKPLPATVSASVINQSYEHTFSGLLDSLEKRQRVLKPTFVFLDPFGYSQAGMHLTGRFLRFARCEVLVYVPLKFVARFVGRTGQENALNSLFGSDRWKEAIPLSGTERIDFLHDLFRDQLMSRCGLRYVRSFEIVTRHRNSGYHLFFGTNHLLGLEKMKDAMWAVDQERGERFADSTDSGMMVLFQPEPDFGQLADHVAAEFAGRSVTIEEVEEFVLVASPFRKAHTKRALKIIEERSGLTVTSTRTRRLTYPARTVMRFS